MLPEEAKYSGVSDEWHRDPVKFTDLYAYVPALRRVLRLSPAAVCAPVVGSDVLNDDNCTNIGNCQQVRERRIVVTPPRRNSIVDGVPRN